MPDSASHDSGTGQDLHHHTDGQAGGDGEDQAEAVDCGHEHSSRSVT